MADNFGLKIGIEGEKDFKRAIADINKDFRVLSSELKSVTSQFDTNDRSIKNLSAQNEVLNKQIENQKNKISTLKAALDNAASSFGENDKRTKEWQIKLNNAEAELNKMNRQLETNKKDMESAENATDEESKALADMGKAADQSGSKLEGLGKALSNTIAAAAAAAAAVSAAFVAIGKQAIELYADYEQLTGGVETLFKDSSDIVKQYADNAYKTAGLSANEYMETVTSFSASLIQSLGGDTEKAAKMADMAIIDMSDNANKMGTDMASIQSAYQGFAKQNYSMLDNLKLGYGGTQEEMYRLMKDAASLDQTFADTAKFSIDSTGHLTAGYADVVQAIHIVQTEMGITGTTAKEASSTISGSLGAMKSAWQNLLTGVASGNKNFDKLIGNMTDSVVTFSKNIIPVVKQTISGLGKLVKGFADELLPEISGMIPELADELLPVAIDSLEIFSDSLIGILPDLLDIGLNNVLPKLITSAISVAGNLIQSLSAALPELMVNLSQTIVDLISNLASPENIQSAVSVLLGCIESIISGIQQSLPILIEGATQLITGLISALPGILSDGIPRVIDMIFGKEGLLSKKNIGLLIDSAINVVMALVDSLPDIISALIDAIPMIYDAIYNTENGLLSKDNIEKLVVGAVKIVAEIVKNIPLILAKLIASIPSICDSIMSAFWGLVDQFDDLAVECAYALAQPIADILKYLPIQGKESLIAMLDYYSSQRKVPAFATGGIVTKPTIGWIGDAGAEAVVPLENNTGWIQKIAEQLYSMNAGLIAADTGLRTAAAASPGATYSININFGDVQMSSDQDIDAVAYRISDIIAAQVISEGRAYS